MILLISTEHMVIDVELKHIALKLKQWPAEMVREVVIA